MSQPVPHHVTFRAVLADPYDGLLRLLTDAQRFGLSLGAVALHSLPSGEAAAELTLGHAGDHEAGQIAARLARHPAVREIAVLPPLPANDTAPAAVLASAGA